MRQIIAQARARQGMRGAFVMLTGMTALGLAMVGAAMSSAPDTRQMQPDAQFPVMAFDLSSAERPIEISELAGETVFQKTPQTVALAKSDRLPIEIKLALAGSATTANLSAPLDLNIAHATNFAAITEPGRENETYVMPGLELASLDPQTGAVHFEPIPGSAGQGVMAPPTSDLSEEEDDTPAPMTTLAVPLPHAKPILDPSLPLPRMRPELPTVASIPNAGRITPMQPNAAPTETDGSANAGAIPVRPLPKPQPLLAFLTPQGPSEPRDAPPPINQPPNTILTPTPFGIPYVLQTQTVDTACLKPELLQILRQVETHYDRKVVITSGYRSGGREGSLHRTCSAADIIVPGVSKQAVAAYARSLPAVGGVGTYCYHASLVHVDIGTPRDWNFCKGGSYFAMRDGTAHWGKAPQQQTQED